MWPMPVENGVAVLVDLALEGGAVPSPLKAQINTTDAREEGSNPQPVRSLLGQHSHACRTARLHLVAVLLDSLSHVLLVRISVNLVPCKLLT